MRMWWKLCKIRH